ncbi:amino-acid N-acetyltransferase [Buchnera aphidicola (Kurisakia onigurumii)]|uniref:amino-acid N-acetyltransferase n=1 Tax=Buchnera aphidicola TaxID=9 RepID=UPI0031B6CDAA
MKSNFIQKLRYLLPYLNTCKDKKFVIMFTSKIFYDLNFFEIIQDIILLHSLGIKIVIIYDISHQVNSAIKKKKILYLSHKQIQITNIEILKIIKEISGKIQIDIISGFSANLDNYFLKKKFFNIISGSNFITAQPLRNLDRVDYLYTGKIRSINTELINFQLNNNSIILISPIAHSVTGECFYISYQDILSYISIEIKADKILIFLDKKGIIDFNTNKIISEFSIKSLKKYIYYIQKNKFYVEKKIIYFLKNAINICNSGISKIHFISYKEKDTLLREVFNIKRTGTQIVIKPSEKIQKASIFDINGILKLINLTNNKKNYNDKYKNKIENEIDNFIVIKKEKLVIACVALNSFLKDRIGEISFFSIHPDYNNLYKEDLLLCEIKSRAKKINLKKIFIFTKNKVSWFQKKGFLLTRIDFLPDNVQSIYFKKNDYKILILDIIKK